MQKANTTLIVTIIVLLLVIGGLFAIPKIKKGSTSTTVACLLPNLPLAMHIHPEFSIEVDGKAQTIPAQIGLNDICERAIHTHDATGQIHVESQIQHDYVLQDFLDVWGEKLEKDGYNLVMTVDGKESQEYGRLILKDKQQIKLIYTKK